MGTMSKGGGDGVSDDECPGCEGREGEYEDMCYECKSEIDGLIADRYWIARGRL